MAEASDATRDDLAGAMDIGQRTALIHFLAWSLHDILPIEDDELASIKGLPQSLRIPVTVRLQETLDTLRDVVATLSFAVIDLGLDQPA